MNHHIRTVYLVHHSHTDIGYTDLQETITARQADFIRSVVQWMQQPENQGFRWNCETLFCVERFLEQASDRPQPLPSPASRIPAGQAAQRHSGSRHQGAPSI